ncbi:MAG: 3-hydroxyacyl-CoA dehydrogenase family protein [Candidatus Dormibacteria bacterium]
MPDRERIFVVGAGLMGSGIAHSAAQAQLPVLLFDSQPGAAQRALEGIVKRTERAEQQGKAEAGSALAVAGRLSLAKDLAQAASASVVIEAVTEDLEVKLGVFEALSRACPDSTIFTSNTSSIPITRLARGSGRPDRFMGMHFYSPVPVMELVELIPGIHTADSTYGRVEALGRAMGKTPVRSADSPGFIGNRILIPYLNEAIQALQQGVGSASDIDQVAKLGFRHPMGPLELADFIGLDVVMGICRVMHQGLHDPRYAPPPLLERLVEAGDLGRKTGRGFHQYGSRD